MTDMQAILSGPHIKCLVRQGDIIWTRTEPLRFIPVFADRDRMFVGQAPHPTTRESVR